MNQTVAHGRGEYRPDIDGLRAIAVALVVVFHVFPGSLAGGFIGVDIFFVISGFLITGIVTRGLEDGSFKLWTFYQRRIRRIFPALAIVLLTSCALGYSLLPPREFAALGTQIVAGTLFVPNFLLWGQVGYFDPDSQGTTMLHLWSLGIEEQFYMVWPPLLVAFSRGRQRLYAGAFGIASFVFCLVLVNHDPVAAFYSPLSRFWELLVGCVLALHPRLSVAPTARGAAAHIQNAASLAGMLLLLLAALFTDGRNGFPGLLALPPTVGAALLIWAGPTGVANRWLSNRGLVAVGLISYPLYLWHWPLLSFAFMASPEPTGALVGVAIIAISLLLSVATHRLIERPIRFGGWARGGVAISTGAMGLACMGGAFIQLTGGLPLRVPDELRYVMRPQRQDFFSGARMHRCLLPGDVDFARYAPECFLDADGRRRGSVMLWGDSHAAGLYPGLRSALDGDRQLAQLTRTACPPLFDSGADRCRDGNRRVAETIRGAPPDTVVLFAHWRGNKRMWSRESQLARSFEQTLGALSDAGVKEVVVVGPFPVWNRHLPFILRHHWMENWNMPQRLAARDEVADARTEATLSMLAARHGARFVSLIDLLCNAEGCLTHVPGVERKLVTWDAGHLTAAGASYVSDSVLGSGDIAHVLPGHPQTPPTLLSAQPVSLP